LKKFAPAGVLKKARFEAQSMSPGTSRIRPHVKVLFICVAAGVIFKSRSNLRTRTKETFSICPHHTSVFDFFH
jgi:hypothetical protein